MCILFIALNQHRHYPLVIAANRDEYYARPSKPMHYWPDQPDILAGRDLEAGGTWLGVNRLGAFAAVTNFRDPASHRTNALSRGALVSDFLCRRNKGEQYENAGQFDQFLAAHSQHYNPFNLVFGNAGELYAWCHGNQIAQRLSPGFHSVSNGPLDQQWPKMSRGVEHLTDYISSHTELDAAQILGIMQDTTSAGLNQLPQTGIDVKREQQLSSIFIRGETYGTRTTTVLLYTDQQIEVTEWNYGADTGVLPASYFVVPYGSA